MKLLHCAHCGKKTEHVLKPVSGKTWDERGNPETVTLQVYVCKVCGTPAGA